MPGRSAAPGPSARSRSMPAPRWRPAPAPACCTPGTLRSMPARLMQRALVAAPGHAAAAANLGAFMRLTGEMDEGEALLRRVLAHNPEVAEARLNLAAALLLEERAGETLALLDERPVPAEPRLAVHWRLQRALALLQLNR